MLETQIVFTYKCFRQITKNVHCEEIVCILPKLFHFTVSHFPVTDFLQYKTCGFFNSV